MRAFFVRSAASADGSIDRLDKSVHQFMTTTIGIERERERERERESERERERERRGEKWEECD